MFIFAKTGVGYYQVLVGVWRRGVFVARNSKTAPKYDSDEFTGPTESQIVVVCIRYPPALPS